MPALRTSGFSTCHTTELPAPLNSLDWTFQNSYPTANHPHQNNPKIKPHSLNKITFKIIKF